MEIFTAYLIKMSLWLLPHLKLICVAKISTLLVIYGDTLNKYIKTNIRAMNFVLRVIVFVMVCTFAYGGLLAFVAPLLAQLLAKIPLLYLSPCIITGFIVIGLLAERRKYI
ncbi:MAG: DUF3392 family protein [Pseudomonadales bacterium]|nr:DUF3392 family protein [Pseudomonadales bacterium]